MRIIVMSDSHGDIETVKAISELSADAIFHCGDSELSFNNPLLKNMYRIRGNCDKDMTFPLGEVVKIGNKTVLIVHGHEQNVNRSLMELQYFAMEYDANIVLFGHTHLYGAEMLEDILFVNPGSTILPRGGKQPSYAVIEWNEEVIVTFKNMSHEVISEIKLKRF